MKVDEFGEVDKYLTAANEPILRPDERVIGFRQLEYRVYRRGILRSPLTDERGGWVWQTTKRVLHLDDKWETSPAGVKGKRVHEYGFMEVVDVVWHNKDVTVTTAGDTGKFLWEYKPFGAAARLFNWLREQREERRQYAKGENKPVYERGKSDG